MWYHPKGIANILSLSNVADNDKYWVRYDSQEREYFIINRIKDSKYTRFHRSTCCIHWIDTKATKTGEGGEVLINTIEYNKSSYTRFSYLHVKLDRKLQRIINQPSVKTLKWIIGRNLLTNCPFNIADVSSVKEISGTEEGRLRRKTVRTEPQEVKSTHVNLPMELIVKYQSVILSADYIFVNGVSFFNAYIPDIRFITSRQQYLKTDLTMQAMNSIKAYYTNRVSIKWN